MKKLWHWFKTLVSGRPHFVIGSAADPYLLRWYLIPRNDWLNIYLHKFLRDDDDRALHDHPWSFVSVMLKGCYLEVIQDFGAAQVAKRRSAISIAYRPASHAHRVVLVQDGNGKPKPCWTLVLTGPKKRVWGIYCPKGFVPWYEFVSPGDVGQVRKGCGEQ